MHILCSLAVSFCASVSAAGAAGWGGAGHDGVWVYAPDGERIGAIHLPEGASNVCFGGAKRNRLFITAGQSVYSLYVETQGMPY